MADTTPGSHPLAAPGAQAPEPRLADVPPRPDYSTDREAGHIWSALSGLREQAGELKAAVNTCSDGLRDVRGDLKDVSLQLADLKAQTAKHLAFVHGAVWVAGVVFLATSGMFVWAWSSIIRPGLAHAIVEQIKPEISRQVSEAQPKAPTAPPARRP